jgi:hypothetical protein
MTAYAPRPGPTRPRCGWPQAPRHLTPRWSSGQREATPASPVLKPAGRRQWWTIGSPVATAALGCPLAREMGIALGAVQGSRHPSVYVVRGFPGLRGTDGVRAREGVGGCGGSVGGAAVVDWAPLVAGVVRPPPAGSLTEQEHDSFLVNDEAPPLRRGLSSVSGDGLLVPVEVAAHKRGHERHESGRSDQGLRLHRSLLSGVGPSDSEPRSLRARLAARGLRPCLCCIRRREAVFVG